MSKNITIKEGGVAKQLTVDKLKTNEVGGGSCLWVPEDEVLLGQKTINANGTYKASDDGLYGYSQVTVSNAGIASGTIPSGATLPTGDGNEYSVTTDNNGNLDFLKIPSSIQITTQPTTTEYYDGDTIDFTGMVVTKYDANGQSMGTIPLSELILTVTEADYNEGKQDYINSGTYKVKSVGSILQTIDYALTLFNGKVNSNGIIEQVKGAFERFDGINPGIVCVSPNAPSSFGGWSPFDVQIFSSVKEGDTITLGDNYSGQHVDTYAEGSGGTLTFRNFRTGVSSESAFVGQSPVIPGYGIYVSSIIAEGILSDTQTIPVKWARTGDGKVLETSFDITVTDVD